jgi:hypothetical protein
MEYKTKGQNAISIGAEQVQQPLAKFEVPRNNNAFSKVAYCYIHTFGFGARLDAFLEWDIPENRNQKRSIKESAMIFYKILPKILQGKPQYCSFKFNTD